MLEQLRRARLRYLLGVAIDAAPAALTVIAAGWLLVCLALPAPLLSVFVAIAAAFVIWRVYQNRLSLYGIAQLVDARLGTNDALSTGFYVSSSGKAGPFAAHQLAEAQRIAASIKPELAFPVRYTRAWWAHVAILILGISALLLRPQTQTLGRAIAHDLVPAVLQRLPSAQEQTLASKRNTQTRPRVPDPNPGMIGDPTAPAAPGSSSAQSTAAGSDDLETLEQQLAREQSKQSSGLMDNLRAAFEGAKDALQQKSQQSRSSEQRRNPSSASSQANQPDAEASQQSDQAANARTAGQAKAIEKSSGSEFSGNDQPASEAAQASHSGAGHREGRKDARDAEDLKAMGKLEEIIGRRSAATAGTMKLDKSSGDQHLQTEYTGQVGEHRDRGGEPEHDQIPPEYRDYVRAYMEARRNSSRSAVKPSINSSSQPALIK